MATPSPRPGSVSDRTNPTDASRTGREWEAPPLRPVAHWVPTLDERGRRRLTMVWSVPDFDPTAVDRSVATA
jgi:hypothetical protein